MNSFDLLKTMFPTLTSAGINYQRCYFIVTSEVVWGAAGRYSANCQLEDVTNEIADRILYTINRNKTGEPILGLARLEIT